MTAVLKQLVILYLFIFMGWYFGHWKRQQAEHSSLLSFLLVNLLLPSKIFRNFSTNCTVPYLRENYPTLLISTGILLVLVLLSRLIAPRLTKDPFERRVFRYSLTISNYAYIGYVLVEDIFGSAALTNMLLFVIPFSVYTNSFGYAMLTGSGSFFKKLVNPLTMAIVLGILVGLSGLRVPEIFDTILKMAADCIGPTSMLLTGLVLSTFTLKELIPDFKVCSFCVLRLLIMPAIVFGLCKLLACIMPLPDAVFPYAVITATMPCGLNVIIFPKNIGEDCKLGARFVLLTHIFSLATLPMWISILR